MKIYIFIITMLFFSCGDKNKETGYFLNGNLMLEVPLKNGKRHGMLKQFYENGNLQLMSEWEDGVKHGIVKSYYPNGMINSVQQSVYGQGEGEFEFYDSLGRLIEVIEFSESKENGKYYKYYPEGSINITSNFVDGKRHGKVEMFYPNGSTKQRMIYHFDELKYEVEYSEDQGYKYFYFEVDVNQDPRKENQFNISMPYSFYDSARIQVFVGELDSQRRQLVDTLDVLMSNVNDLNVTYEIPESYDKGYISGIVIEHEAVGDDMIIFKSYFSFYHEL